MLTSVNLLAFYFLWSPPACTAEIMLEQHFCTQAWHSALRHLITGGAAGPGEGAP